MARLDWDISLDIVLMRMERQAQAMTWGDKRRTGISSSGVSKQGKVPGV
jgi:hypothetical protein